MRVPALIFVLMLLAVAASSGLASAAGEVTVTGQVTVSDGSDPSSVTVTATGSEGTYTAVPSASTGNYAIDSMPEGIYDVSASLNNYVSNVTYSSVNTSSNNLDFTLSPAPGTVTGFVSDGHSAIVGALVTLRGEAGNFSAYSIGPPGSYTIQNVAPGDYSPIATKDGYDTAVLQPMTVTSGATLLLNFTMSPNESNIANLTGTVWYNDQGLAEAKVVLSSADTEYTAITDSQGRYSFDYVVAGNYTLKVSKDGYIAVSQPISIQGLQDRTQDVTMKRDSLPGNTGFLFGYDLPHSLMVVGLALALITLLVALFVRYRIAKKPELVSKEEEKD
jgi:hypothetical protein